MIERRCRGVGDDVCSELKCCCRIMIRGAGAGVASKSD
jgi:hypothetical protein